MKTLNILLGVVAVFSLSACANAPAQPTKGEYTVSEIDGKRVELARPILVSYDDGRLSGNGPVNIWSMPVEDNGKLGMGICTRMAGPEELMNLESKLLRELDGGVLAGRKDKALLVRKDGKIVVVMEPTESP